MLASPQSPNGLFPTPLWARGVCCFFFSARRDSTQRRRITHHALVAPKLTAKADHASRVTHRPLRRALPQGKVVLTMRLPAIILGAITFAALCAKAAESIPIPNGSFESPSTTYASPFMDDWQKTAKPDWYDEGGGAFLWTQLTGEFTNPPPIAANHIDNMDGGQAA